MKILFLGQLNNLEPWFNDVVTAVGEAGQVVLWGPDAPFGPQISDARVVVDQGGSVATRAMIDAGAAAGVKLWQVLGTGLDHVDVQYILEHGLALANTPGPFSSVALAEHALFMMLYFAKHFPATQDNIKAGTFYRPMNDELDGATLGLIGLGASARELARRAAAFDMRLLGIDLQPPPAEVLEVFGVQYLGGPESLDTLLTQSDYVSVHVPLTRRTRHMLDDRSLAAIRPHSVLINVARGGIVDQTALVAALQRGALRGAGLDVFAVEPIEPHSPLLTLNSEHVHRTAAGLPPLY